MLVTRGDPVEPTSPPLKGIAHDGHAEIRGGSRSPPPRMHRIP